MNFLKKQYGFSFVELVVTLSIMLVLGFVGMKGIASTQNYFLITSAQEKIEYLVKSVKKHVLSGGSSCAYLNFFSEGSSNQNNALFFIAEMWNKPLRGDIRTFHCIQNKEMKNYFEEVDLLTEGEDVYFELNLSSDLPEYASIEAFDASFHPVALDVEGDPLPSYGIFNTSASLRLQVGESQEYIVKLYDQQKEYLLSMLHIVFFNADKNMIAFDDPSIIRIENITGESGGKEKKSGDLQMLFEAPHAKSSMYIRDDSDIYLVSNIQIDILNTNSAEGEVSLFHANLFQANEKSKREIERKTCYFYGKTIEFDCL